jgi:hypothetical protein
LVLLSCWLYPANKVETKISAVPSNFFIEGIYNLKLQIKSQRHLKLAVFVKYFA